MALNLDEISIAFSKCSEHKSFKKAIANVIILIFASLIFLSYVLNRIHDATPLKILVAGSILSMFVFAIVFGIYFISSFMKLYMSEYKKKSKIKFRNHKYNPPKFQ